MSTATPKQRTFGKITVFSPDPINFLLHVHFLCTQAKQRGSIFDLFAGCLQTGTFFLSIDSPSPPLPIVAVFDHQTIGPSDNGLSFLQIAILINIIYQLFLWICFDALCNTTATQVQLHSIQSIFGWIQSFPIFALRPQTRMPTLYVQLFGIAVSGPLFFIHPPTKSSKSRSKLPTFLCVTLFNFLPSARESPWLLFGDLFWPLPRSPDFLFGLDFPNAAHWVVTKRKSPERAGRNTPTMFWNPTDRTTLLAIFRNIPPL